MEDSKKRKSGITLITEIGSAVVGANLSFSLADARGILEMTNLSFMKDTKLDSDEKDDKMFKVLHDSTQFLRSIAKKILTTSGETTEVEELVKHFN